MTHFVIFGASRGLGDLLQQRLPVAGDSAWLISRGQPQMAADGVDRRWLPLDLAGPDVAARLAPLAAEPLDVLIYNAGIWEEAAFSAAYRFDQSDDAENERILTVNLTAALTAVRALLPALRRSDNPKIIFIGSVNGLEIVPGPEVAYAASKFGLRGVAHALRAGLRQERIGVTLINPGTFGSMTDVADPGGIPGRDLLAVVRCALAMSRHSCLRRMDIVAMDDPF